MSNSGLWSFADSGSPLFVWPQVLDGTAFSTRRPITKTPSRPANLLEHANGAVTVQLDFTGDDQPETCDYYSWSFPLAARDAATWYLLKRVRKRGTPVTWIDWDQDEEIFVAGPSLTTFTLPRVQAVDVIPGHPDIGEVPTRAWLDGVEQTVITSGTPSSGEVKIVSRTVTTPTLTAGQVLVIRGVWAHNVVVAEYPQSLTTDNILTTPVVLVEAGTSV